VVTANAADGIRLRVMKTRVVLFIVSDTKIKQCYRCEISDVSPAPVCGHRTVKKSSSPGLDRLNYRVQLGSPLPVVHPRKFPSALPLHSACLRFFARRPVSVTSGANLVGRCRASVLGDPGGTALGGDE
jgi:hypothetical protein